MVFHQFQLIPDLSVVGRKMKSPLFKDLQAPYFSKKKHVMRNSSQLQQKTIKAYKCHILTWHMTKKKTILKIPVYVLSGNDCRYGGQTPQ